MKLSATILAAASIFSATTLAAPAPAVNMMATSTPQWTFESVKRTCGPLGKKCTWSFTIDEHTGTPTPCSFVVTGNPASQANSVGNVCGVYTISSGWSGQFGAGNGFTTLAVVNNKEKLIAYPAYTDKELANGKIVSPDRSYTAQKLPSS